MTNCHGFFLQDSKGRLPPQILPTSPYLKKYRKVDGALKSIVELVQAARLAMCYAGAYCIFLLRRRC